MTKYEIKRDTFEFRFGTYKESIPAMTSDEVFDAYLERENNAPVLVGSYDTEEEALAAFDKSGSTRAEKGNVWWLLRGDLQFIEINDYDEDGEFDQGGAILCHSAEGYEPED